MICFYPSIMNIVQKRGSSALHWIGRKRSIPRIGIYAPACLGTLACVPELSPFLSFNGLIIPNG